MRSTKTVVLALCALVAPAAAQETPKPSPKLAAFHPLVGAWTGKGTVVPEEGAPAMQWTGTIHVKPILDGFFFQEDTVVDVGMETALSMRSIYGWDAENERYVVFGCGNTGESDLCALDVPSPGKMVMGVAAERFGETQVARSTWNIDGDKMRYVAHRANGAGDFYVEVDGAFERAEIMPKGVAEASFMNTPVAPEIATLTSKMVGAYDVKGTMTMMPGMPEMKIWGTEEMTPIFGGHTIYSRVVGHADNEEQLYVGETYMTWDPVDRCYDVVMIDNMGAVVKAEGRWVGDDKLVTVFSGPMMGQLAVQRSVLVFGDTGIESATSHVIIGDHAPMQNFHATYSRKTR